MLANRIFDEVNRLFDAAVADTFSAPAAAYPPMNLWEDDDHFYAEAEMSGLKLDDIQITVTHGDQLTISGERKPDTDDNWVWHRQECGYGRFARTVTLPAVELARAVEPGLEVRLVARSPEPVMDKALDAE